MDNSNIKDVFCDILTHDSNNKKPARPYENKFQELVFWFMIGSFSLGLLSALITHFIKYEQTISSLMALLFVILSEVIALIYQASIALQGFKLFKNPTRSFLQPLTDVATKDYQLAEGMIRFGHNELEYVLERLKLEVSQMRSRVGMLVGAIETVGLVPAVVTTAFYAFGYFANGNTKFQGIDWVVYALMGLYVIAVPILFFTQKLDRYALVVETAIKLKSTKAK